MNAPGFDTGFRNHDAAALCHGDKMFEDELIAPCHGFCRIADGAIFIAVRIFHQDRPDAVRPQLRTECSVVLPETFVIMTNLRPVQIDGAAMAWMAMFAKLARWLCKFFDFKHLAAKVAFGAGFSGDGQHL